jgi:SAM-dependent methyltransferase
MDATVGPHAIMARLIHQAGVQRGMRVIDFGCGPGDVTVLLSEAVGPEGFVLGVDISPVMVDNATKRCAALGLTNVQFVVSDLTAPLPGTETTKFDALIGRRVLMYLPDPAATLKMLVTFVKPGGIVAFQEHDGLMNPVTNGIDTPGRPLHDKMTRWCWGMVKGEGGNIHFGREMPAVFAAAGVTLTRIHGDVIIEGQNMHHAMADLVMWAHPRMIATGVATLDEIQPETIRERMRAEAAASPAAYVSDFAFTAWGTVA